MSNLKESLDLYFSSLATYNKNEHALAKEIIKYFEIKSSWDIYKFGQYINYKTDIVFDISQVMQTLDFTLYEGTGDCEDFARAFVILLKELDLPVSYWLMFTNQNMNDGHAVPLYLSEEGFLTILDYTNYYYVDSIILSKEDFENQTDNFMQAFYRLQGAIATYMKVYPVNILVETSFLERVKSYTEPPYKPMFSDYKVITHPHSRIYVREYIKKMNLERNLLLQKFILPIAGALLFGFIVYLIRRWLK